MFVFAFKKKIKKKEKEKTTGWWMHSNKPTYAFSNRKIRSNDFLGINQKYIPNVQMISWDINTA